MFTNPEKISEFKHKNSDITPIVFFLDGQYYSSEHINHNHANIHIDYHTFKLDVPRLPRITMEYVTDFSFFFKTDGDPNNHNYFYAYSYLDGCRIIEMSDCSDCYLLLHTINENEQQDMYNTYKQRVYIYHNFQLQRTVDNVFNIHIGNESNFMIIRKSDLYADELRYFIYNGVEFPEDKLECSFQEWCEAFDRKLLLKSYSNNNAISADNISWTDNTSVEWEFPCGHTIIESPYNRTRLHAKENCQICYKEYLNAGKQRNQQLVNEAIRLYNTNNLLIINNMLLQDTKSLFEIAKSENYWRACDEYKCIQGSFVFPCGKHGDINMYLASTYGKIKQMDATHYDVELPPECHEAIELLVDYAIKPSEIIRSINTRFDLSYKIDMLSAVRNTITIELTDFKDYRALYHQSYDLTRSYCNTRIKKRNNIYQWLVKNKLANKKWVSETQAYAIVSFMYPDAIYQYRPSWLQPQSLDIFIPSLNLAIEYQGQQHYMSIDAWGGQNGLATRRSLDLLKKEKCKANNIRLIEWKYDEPLTTEFIRDKILQNGQ